MTLYNFIQLDDSLLGEGGGGLVVSDSGIMVAEKELNVRCAPCRCGTRCSIQPSHGHPVAINLTYVKKGGGGLLSSSFCATYKGVSCGSQTGMFLGWS